MRVCAYSDLMLLLCVCVCARASAYLQTSCMTWCARVCITDACTQRAHLSVQAGSTSAHVLCMCTHGRSSRHCRQCGTGCLKRWDRAAGAWESCPSTAAMGGPRGCASALRTDGLMWLGTPAVWCCCSWGCASRASTSHRTSTLLPGSLLNHAALSYNTVSYNASARLHCIVLHYTRLL